MARGVPTFCAFSDTALFYTKYMYIFLTKLIIVQAVILTYKNIHCEEQI